MSLKLELNKRYVRRDGGITEPLVDSGLCKYEFYDSLHNLTYNIHGKQVTGLYKDDLVSEYVGHECPPADTDFERRDGLSETLQAEVEQLRARVKEAIKEKNMFAERFFKEQERVKELEDLAFSLKQACTGRDETIAELRTKLDALTRPQLIGQTWQNVYDDKPDTVVPEHPSREKADQAVGSLRIAVLRRDTYKRPDGSTYVEAHLESVEKETEK